MTNPEVDLLQAELQKLQPARAPEDFLSRLQALPTQPVRRATPGHSAGLANQGILLRWLAPALGAAALLALFFARPTSSPERPTAQHAADPAPYTAPASGGLEIDRHLLADFDALGRLPGGELVRFRCREWRQDVVLRDSGGRLVVEQSLPKLEIVPIHFETY